ncbi:MAG: CDC27 family protein [Myxococcota bacterium]
MRIAILVLIVFGATSADAAKRITAAVFPLHSSEAAGVELGYGIADVAAAALYQSGAYQHLHLKQILSVARHRGWTSADLAGSRMTAAAAELLGAPVGSYGEIAKTDTGWRLTAKAFRGDRVAPVVVDLPADTARAVEIGGVALAKAIATLDKIGLAKGEVHPRSRSGAAMRAYLSCYATLVRQPMGLRESHVVEATTLAAARARCEDAVRLDPGFVDAWAALSLASSLSLQTERAAEALKRTRGLTAYVPFAILSEYWLATRFKSNDAGAAVLRDGVRTYPGAMIFLSYLGEHLNITRDFKEALAVWNRYLAATTRSPYALSQKGYSMARLGQLDEAIAVSREAVNQDPESLVVELELASRLVDAKRLDEAAALLEPMARKPGAFGELLSRLGYVYLLQKKHDPAEKALGRALELARSPSEWRTRGRTRYNLAILMARSGKLKEAEDHLLAAAKEGFVIGSALRADSDLEKLKGRTRVAHLFKDPELKLDPKLLQVSPFLTDSGGIPRPEAARPTAPGFSF